MKFSPNFVFLVTGVTMAILFNIPRTLADVGEGEDKTTSSTTAENLAAGAADEHVTFPEEKSKKKVDDSADTTPKARDAPHSLQCYQCYFMKGTSDPLKCEKPEFGKTAHAPCDFPTVCSVAITKNGVTRGCSNKEDGCRKLKDTMIYTCDTDMCNKAHLNSLDYLSFTACISFLVSFVLFNW